jgi:dynein heavy chain
MTQLKSFANPPPSAAVIMEGLCYIFSEDVNVKGKGKDPPNNSDFWDYAKKCLLNDKLIKRVKEIKVEQIRAIPISKI